MLDRFPMMHLELRYHDDSRWRFRADVRNKCRSLAAKLILPPEPDYFAESSDLTFYERIFELLLEDELRQEAAQSGEWGSHLDRQLGEVVVLQRLLTQYKDEEQLLNGGTPKPLRFARLTLGCMIQRRLTLILLDTHPDQHDWILRLGQMWGMDEQSWDDQMVGAGSVAKAVQELSSVGSLRIYLATLLEDAFWKTDVIVVHQNGRGACLNVKTRRGANTEFFTPKSPAINDDKDEWEGTIAGTDSFNRVFHRTFEPTLLFVGRRGGGLSDLNGVPSRTPSWVHSLNTVLEGRASSVGRSIQVPINVG